MLPLSKLLTSQDVHSDSSLILTKACMDSTSTGWQKSEECEIKSNKEFNLAAVGFRTYEAPLFQVLQESGHALFMALIGLTQFLQLSWTHVHIELAMEFLKNYRKSKSSRISMSSSVRSQKITLTKKLIASIFQLSPVGYKHKNKQLAKDAVSSLFDPVTARRNGYYIRDCKDPTYFERLEGLNRLLCFKPPGHLISTVLVDVITHATVQRVDWAGLLLFSLMKELDRVTSSLRQSPCTLVGVHIFLILSNLKIVTSEDSLVVESSPFILLDGYSTANSVASDSFPSSPTSSLPGSPRSVNPGSRLAEILGFKKEIQKPPKESGGEKEIQKPPQVSGGKKEVQKPPNVSEGKKEVQNPPNVSSPDPPQLGSILADVIGTNRRGQESSTVPSGSIRIARRDIPSLAATIGGQKASTIPSGSVRSARKYHFSLGAGVRLYLKRVLQCFQPSAS